MMKHPPWPLLAVTVAVAACSCLEPRKPEVAAAATRPGAPHTDRNCRTGDACVVFVDVTDCSAKGGVSVDASQLGILTETRNLDIYWVIRTEGYEFTRDGVKFKDDSYKREFDHPHPGRGVYSWRDRNDAGGDPFRPYLYAVKVAKADGTQCVPLDPTIINDM